MSDLAEFWRVWLARIPWGYAGSRVTVYRPLDVRHPERVRLGHDTRLDRWVCIEGGQGVELGAYVHVARFAHLNIGGGELYVGDGVGIASGAKLISGTQDLTALWLSAAAPAHLQRGVRGRIWIGAGVLIGTGAIVLPGVHIGEDAVIGAGAVVTHDVPCSEIWAGNPARKIGERHYAEKG